MKVGILPVTETFPIKMDEEGKATVTFRQARTGDNIELANLFNEQSRVFGNDDKVELKQTWNYEIVKRKRVFLVLVGASELDDENGAPLFRFTEGKNGPRLAMSEGEFNKIWATLPEELTEELHTYCCIVNPQWNPALSGEL